MIRLLSTDEAINSLRAAYGLPAARSDETGPPDQIVAEYIRQSISDLVTDRPSVYVTAIMNSVRRQLAPLWPRLERRRQQQPSTREQEQEGDMEPDPIRRVMEALDDLRDVAHIGDGYWVPTPPRLVKLSDETALVVGGLPMSMVKNAIPTAVKSTWISRTVQVRDLPTAYVADETKWQLVEAWLGHPPADLSSWTAAMFAEGARGLRPSAADLTEFQVYRPASNRARSQAFRWVPAATLQRGAQAPVLCRAFEGRQFGMRRYWLGTTTRHRGVTRAAAEHPIALTSVRRLQYGIDLFEGAPTQMQLTHVANAAELTMTNPLPPEERRLLVAFGEDRSPRPGKFPLRYRLDPSASAAIQPLLEKLGVRLVSI